jgi:hypothetical protein
LNKPRQAVLFSAACALALTAPSKAASHRAPIDRVPALVLWAWERPEDLRGLSADTAVAFLAQTLVVDATRIHVSPRRHPLRVSPSTPLIAVTRIETSSPVAGARLLPGAEVDIARMIADTARLPRVVGVQVDFDAGLSERVFYRRVLRLLRDAVDSRTSLSMTALASWCMDDAWLDGLPVDEVVPMLFRMGPTQLNRQRAAAAIRAPECLAAVGTALDEPVTLRERRRRVYVFSSKPWTAVRVAEARERAAR